MVNQTIMMWCFVSLSLDQQGVTHAWSDSNDANRHTLRIRTPVGDELVIHSGDLCYRRAVAVGRDRPP
jgi:hypothetical protein